MLLLLLFSVSSLTSRGRDEQEDDESSFTTDPVDCVCEAAEEASASVGKVICNGFSSSSAFKASGTIGLSSASVALDGNDGLLAIIYNIPSTIVAADGCVGEKIAEINGFSWLGSLWILCTRYGGSDSQSGGCFVDQRVVLAATDE